MAVKGRIINARRCSFTPFLRPLPAPTVFISNAFGPVDDEFRKRLFSYTLKVIETLPAEDREALTLTELDGLSREELSEQLCISLSAAKSRVHRACTKLRKTVEECYRLVTDPYGRVIDWKKRQPLCFGGKNSAT